jgi:hypothetical protein
MEFIVFVKQHHPCNKAAPLLPILSFAAQLLLDNLCIVESLGLGVIAFVQALLDPPHHTEHTCVGVSSCRTHVLA